MDNTARTTLLHYGGAVAFTALAALLRWLLDPLLGDHLPLVTLFGAVAAAAWLGGYRPALLVVAFGYLACAYLFIEPRRTFGLTEARNLVGLAAYLVTCSIIIGSGEAMHAFRRRVDQQQEVVQENQEKFSTFFHASPIAMSIATHPDGVMQDVNPEWERLTGFTRNEAVGKTSIDLGLVPQPEVCEQVIKELRQQGVVRDAEMSIATKTGTRRTILISLNRVEIGGRSFLFSTNEDITDRKLAEEQLQQSERRERERAGELEALLNAVPAPVFIAHDTECRHISGNQAADLLLRNPRGAEASLSAPDAVRPRHFKAIKDGRELAIHELPAQRAARGEPVKDFEFSIVFEDGEVHQVLGYGTPLFDEQGRPRGAVHVLVDITERKRQEEALRISELRWRTLAEALPNLVWTDLPDGQCDWLSSQWGKYTGIPENELLGLRWLETVIHPDDRERTLACWQTACADKADYDLEYRIRRYDGEYHWFKTRGVPVRDSEGKIVYWFGTCTDIEDVKRLEAALLDADRRKDEFLAMLAHELRNPLAAIRNAVQILYMQGPAEAALQNSRDVIDRQVRSLTRLVDDLLDVSRISRGKINLQKQRSELSPILTNAVEASRPLIGAHRHELTLTLPPEPVYVDADTTRLAQVFSNLLNNAAKYTEPGGHIWLTSERQGSDVVVSVKDNGTGIPANKLPALFEMFSQVEGSLARSQGGLGIGLHLVKRLVEMHGGSVTARSEGPGTGSEFVVRLPVLIEATGASLPTREDETTVPTSSLRILIVDDNRDGADSLGMMLRLMGNDVRTAYDGEAAVTLADEFRPDVVLLDIGLPKLDGYEACRRIRQQPWSKGMVLIAVTGWGQEEDRRRSHEAGFDKHLVKPVDPQALMKLLGQLDGVRAS